MPKPPRQPAGYLRTRTKRRSDGSRDLPADADPDWHGRFVPASALPRVRPPRFRPAFPSDTLTERNIGGSRVARNPGLVADGIAERTPGVPARRPARERSWTPSGPAERPQSGRRVRVQTPGLSRLSVTSADAGCGCPVDHWRSHGRAERVALDISQAEPGHQHTTLHGVFENRGRDRVEL
jgi:hypothetical protein